MRTSDFLEAARSERPCDLLLANARIVDVFSGKIAAARRVDGFEESLPAMRVHPSLTAKSFFPGLLDGSCQFAGRRGHAARVQDQPIITVVPFIDEADRIYSFSEGW